MLAATETERSFLRISRGTGVQGVGTRGSPDEPNAHTTDSCGRQPRDTRSPRGPLPDPFRDHLCPLTHDPGP